MGKATSFARGPSKIDYRVAIELLRDGLSPAEVAQAIECVAPGLSERHGNVGDYLHRTVRRAQEDIAEKAKRQVGPRFPS